MKLAEASADADSRLLPEAQALLDACRAGAEERQAAAVLAADESCCPRLQGQVAALVSESKVRLCV